MRVETDAIVCALATHGEHGGVVRLLTPDHGMVAAYVRGAKGRRMRPTLIPGNMVCAQLRSRTESQLPQATVELAHSRAPILAEPLPAAAIDWATSLVTEALAERQPYPRIYQAMAGLLDAVEAAQSARGWGGALARFELLLLAELGYERVVPGALQLLGAASAGDWPAVLRALDLTGDRLFAQLLAGRARPLHDSRARLVARLRKVAD